MSLLDRLREKCWRKWMRLTSGRSKSHPGLKKTYKSRRFALAFSYLQGSIPPPLICSPKSQPRFYMIQSPERSNP
jgi:hypothetical protein